MANLPDREEVQTPQSKEDSKPELLEVIPKTMSKKEWSTAIHHFHLTGEEFDLQEDAHSDLPLVPALLVQLAKDGRLENQYPFYLPESDSQVAKSQPLAELLKDFLDQREKKGEDLRILKEHIPAITNFLNRSSEREFQPFKGSIFADVENVFDLSSAGKDALQKELEILQRGFTDEGSLVRLGTSTLHNLFFWVCSQACRPYRATLLAAVRLVSNGLEALLLVDRQKSPEGRSPESMASVIGDQGSTFLDPTVLSQSIPSQDGSQDMSTERRERIRKARDVLSAFVSSSSKEPPFYLVHSEPLDPSFDMPPSGDIHRSESFPAARDLFQELMAKMVEVFKALRIGQLEIAGDYEPEVHDALLERFDWQSCEADELRSVPPIVIWESAESVYQSNLTHLSQILRSGLPLKILISTPNLGAEKELSGILPDLGQLMIAHRETLVVQSSLAQPSQLVEGLQTLSVSLRPAVAIVAGPTSQSDPEWSWPESQISFLSRSTPTYTYSPDAGSSWAECFSLGELSDSEKPWLTVKWSHSFADGSEESREEALTFAHAAALQNRYRRHFLTIPEEAWSEEQVEIGLYLNTFEDGPPRMIPFIWILGQDQTPQRAILTRELVSASHDRLKSWKSIQELAGINSEYVRRAVEETRKEVEDSARAEIEAVGDRARSEGAAQAIDRLVTVFTNPSGFAAPPTASSPIGVESAEQSAKEKEPEEATAPAQAAVTEEEEEFSAEPYIDSFLCTSCNDCINLNPLLFKYNEEKQAVIGDVSAGNFLQLVKAAEVCPAKCIHPGSPAPSDETATAEVIVRAQAFQ